MKPETQPKRLEDLQTTSTYETGEKVFFTVEPIYKESGKDTLSSVLLRLMLGDIDDKYDL